MDERTPAERQRQLVRRRGRYSPMPRCDGGCGRVINIEAEYWSHPLTDCIDKEGYSFNDVAIALCRECGKAAERPDLQTFRAWAAFVEQNEEKRDGPKNA